MASWDAGMWAKLKARRPSLRPFSKNLCDEFLSAGVAMVLEVPDFAVDLSSLRVPAVPGAHPAAPWELAAGAPTAPTAPNAPTTAPVGAMQSAATQAVAPVVVPAAAAAVAQVAAPCLPLQGPAARLTARAEPVPPAAVLPAGAPRAYSAVAAVACTPQVPHRPDAGESRADLLRD